MNCVSSFFRPRKGVHHPSVIAHGGAFFWLRSFRQRDLEVPPVAWLGLLLYVSDTCKIDLVRHNSPYPNDVSTVIDKQMITHAPLVVLPLSVRGTWSVCITCTN